ncbi:hypothetical protein T06_14532 [Trichinella sp. T6]|nr:hypothetical protein T06_14532 [Trichinella sp. T6]
MDGCRDVGLIELVAGFGFDGPSKGGYQSPFGGSNSDRPFKFAGAIFSPASNSTNHQFHLTTIAIEDFVDTLLRFAFGR